jgi:hypothetical protein
MSHWFDRLAVWSAADGEGDDESLLTRRQAVRAAAGAAAGVGAAGLLGGPLAGRAAAIAGGNSRQCKCWDKAGRINDEANFLLFKNIGAAAITPAGGFFLITGLVGTHAAYLGQVVNCGLCKDDPPLEPPPPDKQPCTQRGGLRLRGDQCAPPPGGAGAEVGGCAGGTSSCPTPGGGDLCCFGSDVCCSGCCCIAEVGCGCCGE